MNITDIINSGLGSVQLSITANDLFDFANEVVSQARHLQQQQSPQEEDELLTRARVMEYLGIKATTLWQWSKMGILTPIKIKRKCLYRKSDIIALQRSNNANNNY